MDFVAFSEEEFGEVGAVLSGDAGDERSFGFGHGLAPLCFRWLLQIRVLGISGRGYGRACALKFGGVDSADRGREFGLVCECVVLGSMNHLMWWLALSRWCGLGWSGASCRGACSMWWRGWSVGGARRGRRGRATSRRSWRRLWCWSGCAWCFLCLSDCVRLLLWRNKREWR